MPDEAKCFKDFSALGQHCLSMSPGESLDCIVEGEFTQNDVSEQAGEINQHHQDHVWLQAGTPFGHVDGDGLISTPIHIRISY